MTDSAKWKGMEVIGAGFGRTGTVSLKKAFEILGYDPCYHMIAIMTTPGHVNFWIKLANGEKMNFDDVFKKQGYKAGCDNPFSTFWKEQLQQYPNAKVVLTVRDPEKWYKSWNETIYSIIYGGPHTSFLANVTLFLLNMSQFHSQVVKKRILNNDFSKENTIKCFNEHNAEVIAKCPKDKLLVFNVSEGWEPLCKFLDKPIPDVPFPHLNDTNDIKTYATVLAVIGGIAVAASSMSVLSVVWYFSRGYLHPDL